MRKSLVIMILPALITIVCICGCDVYNNKTATDSVSRDSIYESSKDDAADRIKDGVYSVDVTLSGGSGKASVASPTLITVTDGNITAELVMSSEHYDYMIVDGEKYLRVNEERGIKGNSVFCIPVPSLDVPLSVVADTTAMSKPHEIEYTLNFDPSSVSVSDGSSTDTYKNVSNETGRMTDETDELKSHPSPDRDGIRMGDDGTYIPTYIKRADGSIIEFDNTVERKYAEMFTIAYSDDGYYYVHIEQTGDFIVAPEGGACKDTDIPVLCKPINNIYLVSTQAMDVFAAIDEELSDISFCSLKRNDWSVEAAVSAFDAGTLKYAGKYSAPDYELLLAGGCDLAIENTMIYHKPEVIKKLNTLGIPTIVEASSYEPHPFGRMEWIKLYGVLTDRLSEAVNAFDRKLATVDVIENTEKKVSAAFFYVTSNGSISVRKSNDYVSRMISLAGGEYVPKSLNDDSDALSTVNMQMESFYAEAVDADILIYNGTVAGEIGSVDELIKKDKLFADFKAVKDQNVYTTGKDLYQETMSIPEMINDMKKVFLNDDVSDKDLTFLKKVK